LFSWLFDCGFDGNLLLLLLSFMDMLARRAGDKGSNHNANANTSFPTCSTAGFGPDSTSYPLPRRRVEAGVATCVSSTEHGNSMMGLGGASEVIVN
jgi:hypothetical protein